MKTSLLLLLTLSACTSVLNRLDLEPNIPRMQKSSVEEISCPAPASRTPQLVGTNPSAQRFFTDFLRSPEASGLDFIEQAVLWTLLQINLRPDLASPTSRLQFLLKDKGRTAYHDFAAPEDENDSYPLLNGLEKMLKGHPKQRPLAWYARLLDDRFHAGLVAGKPLENRLLEMSQAIAENPELRRFFFRGDELLRESERLSRVRFSKLVSEWKKHQRPTPVNETLFSYRKTPKLDVSCNYDFTLYDNSIFLIDKDENVGHLFGLTLGEKAFLAVASQKTPAPKALFGEPVFAGSAKVRSSAFCIIHNEGGEMWVTANQSRDPGQHVYHLFRYGLSQVTQAKDIERLLRHARHMFLSDPLRLVIESSRSRDEQVQELLKLNVPIYNAQHMGNIWAWANLAHGGGRFFIDDRNPGALFCAP